MVLNCWHCQVLLYFFDWRWIKNNPKCLKIKHVQFFEGFFSIDETVKSIPVLCSKVYGSCWLNLFAYYNWSYIAVEKSSERNLCLRVSAKDFNSGWCFRQTYQFFDREQAVSLHVLDCCHGWKSKFTQGFWSSRNCAQQINVDFPFFDLLVISTSSTLRYHVLRSAIACYAISCIQKSETELIDPHKASLYH